jgi:hypothetical protein
MNIYLIAAGKRKLIGLAIGLIQQNGNSIFLFDKLLYICADKL